MMISVVKSGFNVNCVRCAMRPLEQNCRLLIFLMYTQPEALHSLLSSQPIYSRLKHSLKILSLSKAKCSKKDGINSNTSYIFIDIRRRRISEPLKALLFNILFWRKIWYWNIFRLFYWWLNVKFFKLSKIQLSTCSFWKATLWSNNQK